MKTNIGLFLALGLFCLVVAGVYAFLTVNWTVPGSGEQTGLEWVGFVCLLLTAGLGLMLWFYLRLTAKNSEAMDSDNPEGEIEEMKGNYGDFAPWSWWPFVIGIAVTFVFVGLALGWWLVYIGGAIALIGLVGHIFEFSRGPHAH